MRFVVDTMLGTLAKWMRVLGYDTAYDPALDDGAIIALSDVEGRAIISRDRGLCARKPDSLLLDSVDLDMQLSIVAERWPPDEALVLTRCLACNSGLVTAGRAEAQGKVPEGVLDRHSEFWKCPGCGRFYWKGTHWKAMSEKAGRLIACRNNPR